MQAIDINCECLGLSRMQLMENAGASIAQAVRSSISSGRVVLVAGRGNNGGDAFVAARHLSSYEDIHTQVILIGRRSMIKTEEALKNFDLLKYSGIEAMQITDSSSLENCESLRSADIIVDAIFGTGVKGSIREPESTAIDIINSTGSSVISVDIPSGFDPDGNSFEKSIMADKTLTFHRLKKGLAREDVERYTGAIEVIDIGVCRDAEVYVGSGNLTMLNRRQVDSHKGQSGRILVVGGGEYFGAPALTAMASLRTGADIVTLALPRGVDDIVSAYSPNLIVRSLSDDRLCVEDVPVILKMIQSHDVLVIGNGLGRSDEIGEAISMILPYCRKVVVDADGFAGLKNIPVNDCDMILTPHAGEFSRLIGKKPPSDPLHRLESVLEYSRKNRVVTLLKGKVDIISDGEDVLLNRTGNEGMTVGGTGDVLAGIVGTLFAVNPAMEAASCGAFINGVAGDLAFEEHSYGLLATDIIDRITEVTRKEMS